MKFRSLALAGAAAMVLTALPAGFVSTAVAQKKPISQCMTDDGYGRFRPCSSLYKRQHPNWRNGAECMTDDGYGRMRPCNSLYQGPPPTPTKK
jgi:hypothetical protein